MREGRLSRLLRPCAVLGGFLLIAISVYWSNAGFSFDLARQQGTVVTAIGYTLAIICTLTQFVFATNLRELNPTLIFFGIVAYAYSIYSNYLGIVHFQGLDPDKFGAALLSFVVDGLAEPLIAWGMYASLEGDFIGNLLGAAQKFLDGGPAKSNQHKPKPQPAYHDVRRQHAHADDRLFR